MRLLILAVLVFVTGCVSQSPKPVSQKVPAATSQVDSKSPDANKQVLNQTEQLLVEGYQTLVKRNTKKAIEKYFDKAIELCNKKYQDTGKIIYASRSSTESIFYLMKATSENQSVMVVEPTCAEALFLKGYASLDLGRVEIAQQYIDKAIKMSPVNSKYLSERGHIYQLERDFDRAVEYFKKAEEAAEVYSPPELKSRELGRAKRGIAYAYIEQGKLDEAEVLYRECLELDSNDNMALHELKYIENIRNSKK